MRDHLTKMSPRAHELAESLGTTGTWAFDGHLMRAREEGPSARGSFVFTRPWAFDGRLIGGRR